ncbi:MAG: GNAT family N-acetyltransferase [Chitinophagales bacterium]|nr:GNAT family N-acetyltransferase [Chitinophagales bacterium]MDW8428839.1 GNAT family N-acetyltransferase [Chitinophagales bacterium]
MNQLETLRGPAAKQHFASLLPTDAPVFHQPWWLQTCCGDAWDVIILLKNQKLQAYFVYAFRPTLWGRSIIMPSLTPYLGPYLVLESKDSRIRQQEELMLLEQLVKCLPSFVRFESRWYPRYLNWLPFYWKKFLQQTRYTHIINIPSDANQLRQTFSEKINREINKGEKKYRVVEASHTENLYGFTKATFDQKGINLNFTAPYVERLYQSCMQHRAGRLWHAVDDHGRVGAALFVVWDTTTAYYLLGARAPETGNTGALTFLFWHCFKQLQGQVSVFDFEGSMVPGIGRYFRSFGAHYVPYVSIRKTSSWPLRLYDALRYLLKGKLFDF